jgi:hypothetical protein
VALRTPAYQISAIDEFLGDPPIETIVSRCGF